MTLIVAGDHQLVKDCLATVLAESLSRTVVALNSLEEIHGVDNAAIALLDYSMVSSECLEVVRASMPARIPVADYSAPGSADEALDWLGRGFDGYLPRNMGGAAILCAVQLMLRGERFVPSVALDQTCGGRREAAVDYNLSPRQREVLRMVATGASNKHIARALRVEEVTVKSHVKAIFRRLGVRSRTEAARFVLSPIAGMRPEHRLAC